MTPEAMRSGASDNETLPALPLDSWSDTLATLHMWTQIVGKVRLKLCPLVNHWWNVPFYVTARGMTTATMPYKGRAIEVLFDFIEHTLTIETSEGRVVTMALVAESVAEFYKKFMAALAELDVTVRIWTMPREVSDPTPFEQDRAHATYDPVAVNKFWRILVWVDQILKEFRAGFERKAQRVRPQAAFYHPQMKEYLLMYDDVRAAASPKTALMEFLQSTYDAAADCGKWDRKALERQSGHKR